MINNYLTELQVVNIEITNRCNLTCLHCYANSSPKANSYLSLWEIKKILPELKKLRAKKISILGGEVLLRKDLVEIITMIRKAGFKIDSLVTNGTLLNKEALSTLNGLQITNLGISIDGAKRATTDVLRGEGTFKKIIHNTEQAVKIGFKVFFSTTVCKINFKEIDEFIELAKKINVVTVLLNHIFFHGRSICYMDMLKLSPQEEVKTLLKTNELSYRYGSYIIGDYVDKINIIKMLEKDPVVRDYVFVVPCGAANKQILIRSDGWVAPCPMIRNIKLGNIKSHSLKQIWEDSERISFFRRPFYLYLKKYKDCNNCIYQHLCYTGHRCYPYFLPSGLNDKSFYCIAPGGSSKPVFKF